MAAFREKMLLFLAIYMAEKTQGQDTFGIREPFPKNIYPLEFTSAQVTCVAFDSSGLKIPEKILFMRKNRFAIYTEVTADGNMYFTNKTDTVVVGVGEDARNVTRLSVTIHIRNVTSKVDSSNAMLGRHECHAFAVNDSTVRKHGFTVNVIKKSEIPQVSVSKVSLLQHGEKITITCNLTEDELGKRTTLLKRMSWYKDGVLLQSVHKPDPTEPRDSLGPLKLKNVGVRDGGEYTCLTEVFLRNVKKHNVSDSTRVEIAPWFDKPAQPMKLNSSVGDTVSLVCSAKGYPLEVTWKVDNAATCINETDGKYQIHRKGVYEPYVLTVFDLQYSDAGRYYCCISSKCSSDVSTKDKCQVFNLEIPGEINVMTQQACLKTEQRRQNWSCKHDCSNHGAVSLLYKGYLLAMLTFSTIISI